MLYDANQVKREGKSREYNEFCPSLTARDYKDPRLINENAVKQIANIVNTGNWDNPQRGRIYSPEGLSPALNTCGGGGLEPKIVCGIDKSVNDPQIIDRANCITAREDRGVSNHKSEGTAVVNIGLESKTDSHKKWKDHMFEKFIEDSDGEISGCYTNQSEKFGYRKPMKGFSKTLKANVNDAGIVYNFRIRKLTPMECFKLMGLKEEDCLKCQNIGVFNSQLYKQAGNGIVTNCVELLAEHLYKAQYDESYICYDENLTKPQLD